MADEEQRGSKAARTDDGAAEAMETEHTGGTAAGGGRLPARDELAAQGLSDSVEALTTGLASWHLTDLGERRTRAFQHAGGKKAAAKQARAKAAEVRRALLRNSKAQAAGAGAGAGTGLAAMLVEPLAAVAADGRRLRPRAESGCES